MNKAKSEKFSCDKFARIEHRKESIENIINTK